MLYTLTEELRQSLPDVAYWQDGDRFVSSKEHLALIAERGVDVDPTLLDGLPEAIDFGQYTGYPPPIAVAISRDRIALGSRSTRITVTGRYFSKVNRWACTQQAKIISIEIVDSHTVALTIDASIQPKDTSFELLLDDNSVFSILVIDPEWQLLGTQGNGSSYRLTSLNNTDVIRDADGVGSRVTNGGWSDSISMVAYPFARDTEEGCQLIAKIGTQGSFMFGLLARDSRQDTTIYNDQHVGIYLTSPTELYGFFAFANEQRSADLTGYSYLKLICPNKLSPGAPYLVYGLKDTSDLNAGDLLVSSTIPSGTQLPGSPLLPALIPNNAAGCRLYAVALKGIT